MRSDSIGESSQNQQSQLGKLLLATALSTAHGNLMRRHLEPIAFCCVNLQQKTLDVADPPIRCPAANARSWTSSTRAARRPRPR